MVELKADSNSLWADAWRRLKKNRMATVCGWICLFMVFFAVVGPWILKLFFDLDPISMDRSALADAPSWKHWAGTDPLGRDMLARIMEGGRWALAAGVSATIVALVIGVLWGAISAYVGGKTDEIMMRIVDVLYAFPTIVFVIVIMAVMNTKNIVVLFALIGMISWLNMARIVRGQVLSLRNQEFVEASKSLGASTWRILIKHVVPNTLGPVIVYATLSLPKRHAPRGLFVLFGTWCASTESVLGNACHRRSKSNSSQSMDSNRTRSGHGHHDFCDEFSRRWSKRRLGSKTAQIDSNTIKFI